MFSNLRRKWYEYLDKKEYEKHVAAQFPKEVAKKRKGKNQMDASVKKTLILLFLMLSAIIILIVVLLVVKNNKQSHDNEPETAETVTVTETKSESRETVESVETTTDKISESVTEESTTIKRKKKKRKIQNPETETVEIAGTDNDYNVTDYETRRVQENVTEKQQPKEKSVTKKAHVKKEQLKEIDKDKEKLE